MNFAKLQTSFAAAADKTGLIGTLFWWDLGHNRIEHPALLAHAQRLGLPDEILPTPVKPTNAFRRAWRAASRRIDADTLLRQVAETPEQIVVAVVKERPDVTNLDLKYEVLARASFDKRHGAVTILDRTPVTENVLSLFHHYSALTTEDIRAMVLAFVRKSALSIRHAGGVYFIPPALTETLNALTETLKLIGANTVWTLPVADLGNAGETLASLARETLDAEIGAVEAELAAFDARDIQARSSTLERRLQKFEELRARTGLMADALSFRSDGLLEKLTRLENDVKQKLFGGGGAAEHAPSPPLETALDEEAPLHTLEPVDAEAGF